MLTGIIAISTFASISRTIRPSVILAGMSGAEVLYRFPLPAHEISHEEPDCGDPPSCSHEIPTEHATPTIVRTPLPTATEPCVSYPDELQPVVDRLQVDTEGMTRSLQSIGWSALDASSIHLAFITRDSLRAVGIPDGVAADYLGRTLRLASELDDDAYYQHKIRIVLSEADLTPEGVERLNGTIRHELGHGDSGGRFGPVRLYHYHPALKPQRDDNFNMRPEDTRTPLAKLWDFTLAYMVMGLGKLYREDSIEPLWNMDREEQHAEAFKNRHATVLNPLSLRS